MSSTTCILSPDGYYLSSIITTLAGGIITGLTHGALIAFFTAWISWFAMTRILVVGLWYTWDVVISRRNLDGIMPFFGTKLNQNFSIKPDANAQESQDVNGSQSGTNENDNSRRETSCDLEMNRIDESPLLPLPTNTINPHTPTRLLLATTTSHELQPNQPNQPNQPFPSKIEVTASNSSNNKTSMPAPMPTPSPPSILGWIGWLYPAIYFPITQVLWTLRNWSQDNVIIRNGHESDESSKLKLVRGLGIAVTALSLTIDNKARYAKMLRRKFGWLAGKIFCWIHALSTLALGSLAIALMVKGAWELKIIKDPIVIIACGFSVIWMLASLAFVRPTDGGVGMTPNSFVTVLAGLFMGVMAGVFTSAPAFAMISQLGEDGPGLPLNEYLSCAGGNMLDKFLAIFP